uniref:Uncharacterized protein n=1 Tax=Setaria italica TaxID=4555 RepID=K3ZB31_SETIT
MLKAYKKFRIMAEHYRRSAKTPSALKRACTIAPRARHQDVTCAFALLMNMCVGDICLGFMYRFTNLCVLAIFTSASVRTLAIHNSEVCLHIVHTRSEHAGLI